MEMAFSAPMLLAEVLRVSTNVFFTVENRSVIIKFTNDVFTTKWIPKTFICVNSEWKFKAYL